jgi:purine-binding chemotaxis protein CheW
MTQQSYLTCYVQNIQYAISTNNVLEIFPLPELQIIPETPGDILGVLNLRGKLIPVMHLRRRISRSMAPCTVTDNVVVVECGDLQMGLIVDRVSEVYLLPTAEIDQDLAFGRQQHVNTAFLTGVIQYENENLLILNPDALVSLPDEVANWVWQADETGGYTGAISETISINAVDGDFYELYFPTATSTERELLGKRAIDLRFAGIDTDSTQGIPLAVFGLGGEYFGIRLPLVREFINTHNIRAMPCSPAQIIGNMNLRGEIMTLVDVRPALNLSTTTVPSSQAVITQIGDVVAGLSIDELHDIIYLDPAALLPVPVANQQSRTGLVESTTPYRDTMLSVLDLPQLLNIA